MEQTRPHSPYTECGLFLLVSSTRKRVETAVPQAGFAHIIVSCRKLMGFFSILIIPSLTFRNTHFNSLLVHSETPLWLQDKIQIFQHHVQGLIPANRSFTISKHTKNVPETTLQIIPPSGLILPLPQCLAQIPDPSQNLLHHSIWQWFLSLPRFIEVLRDLSNHLHHLGQFFKYSQFLISACW